jgi:hypothetical protein
VLARCGDTRGCHASNASTFRDAVAVTVEAGCRNYGNVEVARDFWEMCRLALAFSAPPLRNVPPGTRTRGKFLLGG